MLSTGSLCRGLDGPSKATLPDMVAVSVSDEALRNFFPPKSSPPGGRNPRETTTGSELGLPRETFPYAVLIFTFATMLFRQWRMSFFPKIDLYFSAYQYLVYLSFDGGFSMPARLQGPLKDDLNESRTHDLAGKIRAPFARPLPHSFVTGGFPKFLSLKSLWITLLKLIALLELRPWPPSPTLATAFIQRIKLRWNPNWEKPR